MTRSSTIPPSSRSSSAATFEQVIGWDNLLDAWHNAALGKRGKRAVATFEYRAADNLVAMQSALREGTWRPGPYVNFQIHSPKTRLISAAPFADRVVHHAVCNVIGPLFERLFIADSYANRTGKGTHRAVDRLQQFARRYRYALRLDVVKHFETTNDSQLLKTRVMSGWSNGVFDFDNDGWKNLFVARGNVLDNVALFFHPALRRTQRGLPESWQRPV